MLGTTLATSETAFLLQSTAFVGSPANPEPNQEGGGIWVRGVGGTVDAKSATSTAVTATNPVGAMSSVSCSQKIDENFAGVQFGSDIARLNVNGWNFHLGTTVGYLGTSSSLVGGAFAFPDRNTGLPAGGGPFAGSTSIPFMGTYAAATHGGFAIDALLRTEYYQTTLNAPASNIFGQNIDAYGLSFSSSITYQWQVPNSHWFVEPSAGVIISRAKVDPFNYIIAGTPPLSTNAGTLQLRDIDSDIGRIGLRAGTTIDTGSVTWQPFAAVSVWHEFGPNITSSFVTCPGCTTTGVVSATSSTSTYGTYGQYSVGISGALARTGWLGFARFDYRDGSNLQGVSATGGLRYQFAPEAPVRRTLPVKAAPASKGLETPVNWTGFYAGVFSGAVEGRADWGFAASEVSPDIGGYLFGGDFGYNKQFGSYVVGLEGDISYTNSNGGIACAPLMKSPRLVSPFEMTCNASTSWLEAGTARFGYAVNRLLLYAKAGGAWTNERFLASCNFGPINGIGQSCTNPAGVLSAGLTADTSRFGTIVGIGTEFALTSDWSAKAEIDYVTFGDRTVTASDGSLLDVGMHIWQAKVGLDYRFDPSMFVATY